MNKMLKPLAIAAMSIAMLAPAKAKDLISPELTGMWCLTNVDKNGWSTFNRVSKCQGEMTLVLRQNGDYVLTGNEYEARCKADPKSYFKGWTDYICSESGEGPSGESTSKKKYHLKFLIDTETGELMQSPTD
jgi:hypothetical protein